jgi:hypothetical protein
MQVVLKFAHSYSLALWMGRPIVVQSVHDQTIQQSAYFFHGGGCVGSLENLLNMRRPYQTNLNLCFF